VVSYVDAAVAAGNTYYYQVAAVNLGGASAYSNIASATIPGVQPPVAPSDLQAQFEDIPLIHLDWVDNSADETSFLIQRSTDGVNFADLASVGADVVAYDDLAVSGGFTYTYRVAAVNANGTSAFSNVASATVPPDVTPPAAPSNLTGSNITKSSVTLNWMDNSANETGFTIQRSNSASFSKVVTYTVGPNVTSFNVTGLNKNTNYYFRVRAFNLNFTSVWSPTLQVTTLPR
jgi:titin